MATSLRTNRLTKFCGAAGTAAVLVLAPIGAGAASAVTHGAQTADSSAPQCQLFGPVEGGIEQFEQAFDSGSGQKVFTGQADIAQQFATGSGCPIPASSGGGAPSGLPSGVPAGPPSSGGGGSSSAPQCQLFDPVTGGLQQVEAAFDSGSGQGAFAGSNDVAAAIDSGAGCTGTKPLTAPSGGSSGGGAPSGLPAGPPSSGGGGSSSGPQCQLFDPVTGGIQQAEAAFDSGSGQGAFTGSNDVAAAIDSGAGCTGTKPLTASSGSSGSSSSGGGNPQSSTGGQGGSSGGGSTTSPSGGSSGGSGGGATFADNGGSATSAGTGGGSGSLPFTGEPSWIPLAGVIALVLALVAALLAIGLRVAARFTA
ncbi:MAG: hypothetical protein ACYDA2_04915 [Acidimicrobiales bacterium]